MGRIKHVLKEPAVWMIWLGAALIYSWVYPLPYQSESVQPVDITIVDLDQSTASRALIRHFDTTQALHVNQVSHQLSSPLPVPSIVIPNALSQKIQRGQSSQLAVHLDGNNLLAYSNAASAINGAVDQWSQQYRDLHAYAQGQFGNQRLLILQEQKHHDSYLLYLVPAIFAFLLQQTLVIAAAYWQSAHNKHSWQSKILALAGSLLALIYLFAGVLRHFGVEVNNWYFMLQVWLPMALAALYLGKLSGYLIKTPDAVFLFWVPLSLPLLMLSGFSWPVAQQAAWLQGLAQFFPSTHAVPLMTQLCQSTLLWADIQPVVLKLWQLLAIFVVLDVMVRGALKTGRQTTNQ